MYGIVKPVVRHRGLRGCRDLVEKPADRVRLQATGRLPDATSSRPLLFDAIRRTGLDHRGEIQLTNAIRLMLSEGRKVVGVRLPRHEKRYDIGNFESYFETFVEFAPDRSGLWREAASTRQGLLGENS
jgi:UTP--glucose-1-phosphate uridylyltransferase